MKIIFLCGSLEPGRDGVGDYTRRLAGELIRKGHQAAVVAINDRHITEELDYIQEIDNVKLSVLRVPSTWNTGKRFDRSSQYINSFDPEWISLQYVPFSFHPKGLALSLSKKLSLFGKGRSWHIMFHELWVGMDSDSGLKHVWWGKLQKLLIKSLLNNLKPSVIHTQTNLYQLQLANLGIEAVKLPLFSNIPVLSNEHVKNDSTAIITKPNSPFYFVLFGGIHPGAPVELFAKEAAIYANEEKVQLILRIVGRCGKEQDHWISSWKAVGLVVEILGELPENHISQILSESSIGIATTPFLLLEKSGTVAAMREHGLSIISVSRPWKPKGDFRCEVPKGIMEYKNGNFKSCIAKRNHCINNKVSDVSHQLVLSLTSKKKLWQP